MSSPSAELVAIADRLDSHLFVAERQPGRCNVGERWRQLLERVAALEARVGAAFGDGNDLPGLALERAALDLAATALVIGAELEPARRAWRGGR